MAKQNFEFKLKSVLLVFIIAVILIHMGISDLMSARTLQRDISSSVDEYNKLLAEALSDKLIEMFRSPSNELNVIATSINKSADFVKGFDEGVNLTAHMRSFDRVILVDNDEKVITVWPYNNYVLGMDQSGSGYKTVLEKNRITFWSSTYINYTNGKTSIDLIIPLKTGYLIGTIYLEELSSLLSSLEDKPGTIIAITDNSNTYIAHTDPEKVRQRIKDSYLVSLYNNSGDYANKQEIQIDGIRMKPFVKELNDYGWNILVYYPISLYEKPVWNLITKILLVQLVTLILVLIILTIGFNYFNKIIKNREHQILDKNKEIQSINDDLEIRINERTVDLELANQNLNHTMQSLIETQERLIQQEKLSSLGNLVEGISHEINTPLGICITTSTFIEKEISDAFRQVHTKGLSKDELIEFLETMDESSKILSSSLKQTGHLIDNFKNISVSQKSFSMVESLISEIIGAVFLELGYSITDPKFDINISPSSLKINCFPEDMVLILFNLLRNAIVHGIALKSDGKISIDVKQQENGIVINVTDNGKGIPKSDLKRIFEPFYTTQRGSIEKGSSGLGLYIIYNLVDKRYNGSIECDSTEGSGSSFIVTIPDCIA